MRKNLLFQALLIRGLRWEWHCRLTLQYSMQKAIIILLKNGGLPSCQAIITAWILPTTHILIPVFLPGQSPTRVLKQSEQRSTLPAHLIYIIFMILPARFILQRQWKNTMQTSGNTSNKRKVLGDVSIVFFHCLCK